jgi:hypothetical protein
LVASFALLGVRGQAPSSLFQYHFPKQSLVAALLLLFCVDLFVTPSKTTVLEWM